MKRMLIQYVSILAAALIPCAPLAAGGQTQSSTQQVALPQNKGFSSVQTILSQSCSGCHSWVGSYRGISGFVLAGRPEKSRLFQKIASDNMPPYGAKLSVDKKALIYAWIEAGAGDSDTPLTQAPPVGFMRSAASGSMGEGAEGPEGSEND